MLPALGLTRVPRLNLLLNWVAGAMVLANPMMDYFGLLTAAQVVLLSIVIRTSQMHRIGTPADEEGAISAFTRLVWTGITANDCFVIRGSITL